MARFGHAITISAAGLALGAFCSLSGSASAQTPTVEKTRFEQVGFRVDVPKSKGGAPVLLSEEKSDVDADGKVDTVSYFDTDSDGVVDSEVIDLGSTGTASVLAIRCDADGDGKYDDWLVVDAESEQAKAMLIDANDDGEVDKVAFADGSSEPVQTEGEALFRPVAHN